MKFSLPHFAINRPITVVMLSLCMLTLGTIAWTRMPLKFLPDIDQPFMGVSIPYPGASPEQVEQQIAIPVEGAFRTIPGLRQIRTISNTDGCFVSMLFDLNTNMTLATGEVRDRMERLKLVLPREVDRMYIQRFSSQAIPVIAIGLFQEGDQEEFVHQLRRILEPRLRRVEGVAEVQVRSPVQEKEVLVEFEQDTLRSLNLALADVISTLRDGNLNMSMGALEEGEKRYLVRTEGEYRRIEDIADMVIAPNGLRLREVATVRFAGRGPEAHVSFDGKGGAIVLVTKESEANTVATCDGVRVALDEALALPTFDNVASLVFFDQSELITGALDNLLQEGLFGATMALLVLFFFLHRVRPTIIVALTIPTALVSALVFMFFAGMSLNLITMVSMIISVGMLVDNSIVVVENILRHRQLGYGPKEAAERGAGEVSLAVLASTTTTWVVFVPMIYMQAGQMSVFMEQLGLPLVMALAGSLLIALTLIPLTMSRMRGVGSGDRVHRVLVWAGLRKSDAPAPAGRPWMLERVLDGYAIVLGSAIRWRLPALALLGGLLALTYYIPYQAVGMREMPKLDTREVSINVEVDQNYDMERTRGLFQVIEEQLNAYREELGIKNVLTFFQQNGGVVEAYLYTEDDGPIGRNPPYSTDEVMHILQARLGTQVPGAKLHFERSDTGASGSERAVSLQMRGDDIHVLRTYAESFRETMAAIDHLYDVTTDVERSQEEMQLRIDDSLATRAGVSPLAIAQTVDAALRGARLPELKQGGREIRVWAQFREEDRASRANLENVTVSTQFDGLVPLNQLVEFHRGLSPSAIQRVNAKNVVTLQAKTRTDDLRAVQRELRQATNNFELPHGYDIEMSGQLLEMQENAFTFMTTLLMALVLVYLVMAALFESYLLPLSILSSVPLALGGAVWMLFFTGLQLDAITFVGCILMSGLIVNNGIVIVDHINTLRRRGLPRAEAIVQGGRDRFRPVLMTALTTILCLVPLAVAKTGGAGTFAGLGQALIGGMAAGTMLTLCVVPLFYTLLDDLQRWLVNFFGNLANRGRIAGEVES